MQLESTLFGVVVKLRVDCSELQQGAYLTDFLSSIAYAVMMHLVKPLGPVSGLGEQTR